MSAAKSGAIVEADPGCRFAHPGYDHPLFRTGSKLIFSRCPVALANRPSVRVEGMPRPLSNRAIVLCVVFMRFASSAWLKPERARALATAAISANSSSIPSYSLRYAGSFIHLLCKSLILVIEPPWPVAGQALVHAAASSASFSQRLGRSRHAGPQP